MAYFRMCCRDRGTGSGGVGRARGVRSQEAWKQGGPPRIVYTARVKDYWRRCVVVHEATRAYAKRSDWRCSCQGPWCATTGS